MQTLEIKSHIKVNEPLHRNKIFSNCTNSMQVSHYFDFIHGLEVVANRNCVVGWCSADTVCAGAANSIMDLLRPLIPAEYELRANSTFKSTLNALSTGSPD